MVTASQDPTSAGQQLLSMLEELGSSHGEGRTTDATEILLREGFGLTNQQISRQYKCSNGKTKRFVDFAVFYVNEKFHLNPKHPKILLELKSHKVKLDFGSKTYFETVDQLKQYMGAKECCDVEHGIVFNIRQLQVFRKHENLVYPITQIIDLKESVDQFDTRNDKVKRIDDIIAYLKKILIEEPQKCQRSRGTIITIWNNKGGVGKTTVAYFLSYLLSGLPKHPISFLNTFFNKQKKRKVLAIDFDHNQGDLTKNFKHNLSEHHGKMFKLLEAAKRNDNFDQLNEFITSIADQIDFIGADTSLCDNESGRTYSEQFTEEEASLALRKLCLELIKSYDYIIIDAPANYQQNIYAREAVNAADCLLPIALWGGRNSFDNYYSVVCDLLPRSRHIRKDGGPENLGLWINRWQERDSTTKQQTLNHIKSLVGNCEENKREELKRSFDSHTESKVGNLGLIKESTVIGKANYLEDHKAGRVAWYKRTIEIYAPLIQSIIGEKK